MESNEPKTAPARALIISETADFALLMVAEVVRYGCEPDYLRIEEPDHIEMVMRTRPWDLLVGAWSDATFASVAARAALINWQAICSLMVVNYGGPSLLAIVANGDPQRTQQAGRLAAAIDRMFREVPIDLRVTSPAGGFRGARTDCESMIVSIRSALQTAAGPAVALSINLTPVSNYISIRRKQFEALCTEIVTWLSEKAGPASGTLDITVSPVDSPAGSEPMQSFAGVDFQLWGRAEELPVTETSYRDIESREQAAALGLQDAYDLLTTVGGRLAVREWSTGAVIEIAIPLAGGAESRGGPRAHPTLESAEAALRVLTALVRQEMWSPEDEAILRRWQRDLESPIETIAWSLVQEQLPGRAVE